MTHFEGMIDLHCHYVPNVDDGVRSLEDGVALCQGLYALGFAKVIATPHIRSDLWPNQRTDLEVRFAQFEAHLKTHADVPAVGLGAEHYCDDKLWEWLEEGRTIPYPGQAAMLIEFPYNLIPLRVEQRFFRLTVKGLRPVLAHPERYSAAYANSHALEVFITMETPLLLDLMSLTGKYGRQPQKTAERLLAEDVYTAACSDAHKPLDVPVVQEGLEQLVKIAGKAKAQRLLCDGPQQILEGFKP